VFYPERFNWENEKEAVWDWILDENHPDNEWRNYLLGDYFDSVGIACNCHIRFGEVCVVELGRHVVPKIPDHEHPSIPNGYFSNLESHRALNEISWNMLEGPWGELEIPTWWKDTY